MHVFSIDEDAYVAELYAVGGEGDQRNGAVVELGQRGADKLGDEPAGHVVAVAGEVGKMRVALGIDIHLGGEVKRDGDEHQLRRQAQVGQKLMGIVAS